MNAPVIPSACNIVWALHIGGHGIKAKRRIAEAQELAAQLRRPFSHAFVHLHTIVPIIRREYADVRTRSETLIELSTEYGFRTAGGGANVSRAHDCWRGLPLATTRRTRARARDDEGVGREPGRPPTPTYLLFSSCCSRKCT